MIPDAMTPELTLRYLYFAPNVSQNKNELTRRAIELRVALFASYVLQ